MDTAATIITNDSPDLLNALRALFGSRAPQILASCGGSAAGIIDAARYRRGAAWEKVRAALLIKERALLEHAEARPELGSPAAVRQFLTHRLGNRPYESFLLVFLTHRHTVIGVKEVFRGTLDGASVYPREVVREAMEFNAAALICAHCHPSGVAEASHPDKLITTRLREALSIVDIRLLDHVVIGANASYSFAEHGLL